MKFLLIIVRLKLMSGKSASSAKLSGKTSEALPQTFLMHASM